MEKLYDSLKNNTVFYIFLMNNIIFSVISGLLLWFYRDLIQSPLDFYSSGFLTVFYILNFTCLYFFNRYFNLCFDWLISNKLYNLVFKIRTFLPFTRLEFLFIVGLCSLICYLFRNPDCAYMHYYSLLIDSLRFFMAPFLLYVGFFKLVSTEKLLSILDEKNYFQFKKTTPTQVRAILEGLHMSFRQFSEMPMDKKLALLGMLSGPLVLSLERGVAKKNDIKQQIEKANEQVNRDEQFFFDHYGSNLSPDQQQIANCEFERIGEELALLSKSLEYVSDPAAAIGWWSHLFGRNAESWETLRRINHAAIEKRAQGLAFVYKETFKYPKGSLGDHKATLGLDSSLTPPDMFPSPKGANSMVESTCFCCKKLFTLLGF